jgi:AraC-like DNA-binding protein
MAETLGAAPAGRLGQTRRYRGRVSAGERRDEREVGGAWARFQQHGHLPAAADLAPFVSRYWWARWDLRGQPDYRQLLVPNPSVHLTSASDGTSLVRGVPRRRVHRTLSGVGGVFGVTFRPGTFRRFLGRPVATLTDRTLPATAVFGPAVGELALAPPCADLSPTDGLSSLGYSSSLGEPSSLGDLEAILRALLPPPDPVADQVAGWVEEIARSPELRRMDLVAERFGVGPRRLQRLFAEHVGVSPKWVIRRYRLHEVTERLAARRPGAALDWAGLAAEFGYADQAHLTRDFTRMFGEPPTAYAARY